MTHSKYNSLVYLEPDLYNEHDQYAHRIYLVDGPQAKKVFVGYAPRNQAQSLAEFTSYMTKPVQDSVFRALAVLRYSRGKHFCVPFMLVEKHELLEMISQFYANQADLLDWLSGR